MESLLITLVASVILFTLFAFVVRREDRQGGRMFLSGMRDAFDRALNATSVFIGGRISYLEKHIIKMSWYYSVHKILRFFLAALVRVYDMLEAIFMKNRARAKTLKMEKRKLTAAGNHLNEIAKHKNESELTPAAKKKLLKDKLERG